MNITTELKLRKSLRQANSYSEWRNAAREYDNHRKLDRWRKTDQTSQYDYLSIRRRLDELRRLKARGDVRGLLYTLNEGIHGNMDGMGRSGLYTHALSGTKHLIESYIDEVAHTLELLSEEDSGDITAEEKLDFFKRASHCYGRSALMLSGSGSLLYFHVGVVRALAENGLLPAILSGSSGGAIVGAFVASHSDEDLAELLQIDYLVGDLLSGLTTGSTSLEQTVEGMNKVIPDLTFQQSLNRSGRAINVSIAPAEMHQTSRLLNATTSPSVLLRSAVMASAAVPGIFPPVTLEAIDGHGDRMSYLPGRKWVDGSVSEDLPAKRLARLYGVNHYIVSQTNPLVIPFINDARGKQSNLSLVTRSAQRTAREWFNTLTIIADRADKNNGAVTRATSMMRSILNQDYMADINILPDYRFQNPTKLMATPSQKQMRRLIEAGERCTWPKLERIRQQTLISRKLNDILMQYNSAL